jgi:hypothetical protein
MKRGFITAIMLLLAVLLSVALGLLPLSVERFQAPAADPKAAAPPAPAPAAPAPAPAAPAAVPMRGPVLTAIPIDGPQPSGPVPMTAPMNGGQFDSTPATIVNNRLVASTQTKGSLKDKCGLINGVNRECQLGFTCSNGACKIKQGAMCRGDEDCEFGNLCATFKTGDIKLSFCAPPQ